MTDKKENILKTALELFSKEGFNTVSTNKIAKRAKVSEGLIFRHFQNKKGLLDAIMKDAEEKMMVHIAPVIFETKPQEVIRKFISMPFDVDEAEFDYWRLQFKLKWETEYNNPDKMKPLLDKLEWAFTALGYENPAAEAQMLSQLMDSIAITALRDGVKSDQAFRDFLLKKYQVDEG